MATPVKVDAMEPYLSRSKDLVMRGMSLRVFSLLLDAMDWDYLLDLESLDDHELRQLNGLIR